MRRTSMLLDTELISQAARVLGTSGTTATVREALARAIRDARLEDLAAWELPASFPEQLASLRAPRYPAA